MEVVANRVVWSLVFLVILTLVTRSWAKTIAAARSLRTVVLLAIAAAFLALNWGVYVWAVVSDQVVEASLGYFINPLVSVGLGVRRPARAAAARPVDRGGDRHRRRRGADRQLRAAAVDQPHPRRSPSASTACSRSRSGSGAVESLTIETAALAPIALVVMAYFAAQGTSAMTAGDPEWVLLLVLLGPVTAIPLLAFGGAATRIPLSTLGLMQYFTPVFQFLLGVFYFGEAMSTTRWIGFLLIWTSLVVMSVDGLRHSRNRADDLEVTEPD